MAANSSTDGHTPIHVGSIIISTWHPVEGVRRTDNIVQLTGKFVDGQTIVQLTGEFVDGQTSLYRGMI